MISKLEKVDIVVRPRKLKATWTVDVNHNLDFPQEQVEIMIEKIVSELRKDLTL